MARSSTTSGWVAAGGSSTSGTPRRPARPRRWRSPGSSPTSRTAGSPRNPSASASDDLEPRNGDDEPRAPRPGVFELGGDLVSQVPGQDPDVVRLGLGDALDREDRVVRA